MLDPSIRQTWPTHSWVPVTGEAPFGSFAIPQTLAESGRERS